MEWNDFNKFANETEDLLPSIGEGETVAEQIVTAVSKLVYKWFNDGDVYDITTMPMGWNDLSSYANWLAKNAPGAYSILRNIDYCFNNEQYTNLLYELCELTMNMKYLEPLMGQKKIGSIYECDDPFFCEEGEEDDEDDYYED